jgi:hypothetical protein
LITEKIVSNCNRKFFRQTIIVTIVSEDAPLEWDDLRDVAFAMNAGDSVGQANETTCESLTPEEAAKALLEVGSEPVYFRLSDSGEELE